MILGPDFAGGVTVTESTESTTVAPQGIGMKPVLCFIVPFFGALSSLPWTLPHFGVELTLHLSDGAMTGIILALWGLILPTFVAILWAVDRVAKRIGPGFVFHHASGTVELPWIGRTIPRSDVRCLVQLSGRHRYGGNVNLIVQWGVLFEDDGLFTYAPIAKSTATHIGGPFGRLLNATALPSRRISASSIMG